MGCVASSCALRRGVLGSGAQHGPAQHWGWVAGVGALRVLIMGAGGEIK